MNTPVVNTELLALRRAINGVDAALADLLACRAGLSRQAQAAKAQAEVPVLDPAREEEVRERYEQAAPGASSVAAAILEWCRR